MAEATKTADLAKAFKILKDRAESAEEAKGLLEAELIEAIEPDPELLYPYEPDYVDGYDIKVFGRTRIKVEPHLRDAYYAGEPILLIGDSGNGKSTIATHLIDLANEKRRAHNRAVYARNLAAIKKGVDESKLEKYRPLEITRQYLSCGKETRRANIIGDVDIEYDAKGNKRVVIRYGALVLAWTLGRTLIVDEMDKPDPGVWADAHQLLDGRTNETDLYINGQTHIKKHERFRIIATANDPRCTNSGEYTSSDVQDLALLNRFTVWVKVDWLQPDKEAELIVKKTGIRKDIVEKMITFANQTRKAKRENVVEECVSTRTLLAWAREIVREEKRSGSKASASEYWNKVAIPAASMTVIMRLTDEATQDAFIKFLSIH